jgi:hypothetical protein
MRIPDRDGDTRRRSLSSLGAITHAGLSLRHIRARLANAAPKVYRLRPTGE